MCFQKVQSKDTEVFEGSLEFEEKNKFTTDLSPDGPHIRACVYSLHLARECSCYDLRQLFNSEVPKVGGMGPFGMTTKSLQGQIILFIGIFLDCTTVEKKYCLFISFPYLGENKRIFQKKSLGNFKFRSH